MKNQKFLQLFAASLLLYSCQKDQTLMEDQAGLRSPSLAMADQAGKVNTFYGPQVSAGHGKMRSWITLNHKDMPLEMGVEMTAGSLEGLPTDAADHMASTFVLPLHQKARMATAFNHLDINWNPEGHEPDPTYMVPHFDFHFYLTSHEEHMAIPPYPDAMAEFDNRPAPGYIPYKLPPFPVDPARPYLDPGGGVPGMGKHWIDLTSPEISGAPFTYTFIYGSYDGKVTFYEPMITHATIMSQATINKAFATPTMFNPDKKWYPSAYNIWHDDVKDRYYVSLSDFHWR